MWISWRNDSDCLIIYPNCPIVYCNTVTLVLFDYPNKQYFLTQSGLLCRQFTKGLSLMSI